ncbi:MULTISPECIES: hypothetical protein [unclassified Devosia]|uniref:hypothetical protein n=1 Tax=unclassified Devosia TaxID=196773 RepID=UPI001AC6A7A6|nr:MULTISPECIES: hypothetical protein [unclassified Devosia]MBN9361214.1 hypothetical protein [Devosia sp.]
MEERNRWIELIKGLRERHLCSLDEAHRLALADPHWRRWVERQINSDPQCRKMALRHIRHDGPRALLEDRSGRLLVRWPAAGTSE